MGLGSPSRFPPLTDERDVQANIAAPDYGTFYNPIQRSIGFLISTSNP